MLNAEVNAEQVNYFNVEDNSEGSNAEFDLAHFNLVFAIPNFRIQFSIQHSAFSTTNV
jgi:hypothetical protein